MTARSFKGSRTFEYSGLLAPLPVPELGATVSKYLRSLVPLGSEEEVARSSKLAEDFLASKEAALLQQGLLARAEACEAKGQSWLEEWWLMYGYWAYPQPIAVTSNFFINAEEPHWWPSDGSAWTQASCAASLCRLQYQYSERLRDQRVEAHYMGKHKQPLCMDQYNALFTTTRIPGLHTDRQERVQPSHEITVIHRHRFYMVDVRDDLARVFLAILQQSREDAPEYSVGLLTGGERPNWAEARSLLLKDHHSNLNRIERSLFVVVLEDAAPSSMNEQTRHSILGDCSNRFFDKIFSLIVFSNGRWSANGEHAPADALTHADISTYVCDQISATRCNVHVPEPQDPLSAGAEELKWDLSVVQPHLEKAWLASERLRATLDIRIAKVPFSSALARRNRVSPDTFIQLAIQLAYYNIYGRLAATYETAHTRMFSHGRTETVRSCTQEALDFCRTPNKELLMRAAKFHKQLMLEALQGKGCDRHLFGLKLMAKELGITHPFLSDPLLERSGKWILSTSNVPIDNHRNGGFGFMYSEGAGICYQEQKKQGLVNFSISCDATNPDTSSEVFENALKRAFETMSSLLAPAAKL